ncbi:hypothetical protein NNJEOMEG_01654 [Fundidesulfovibrio magnetotacticus]|uniref:Uncharacterized protein n=1 Tax=Fundidesulfovibrio magnetotacticus TaxID=2730080 RepID=A0A6V8LU10_9BACT|nr:hypothetical protein [Fundidesulfovibrio magnetotacticus]GFK93818.1 hypothetical protein NNJEOMEG_01654 [Fundidesulfovibrio magnetotacticus]
MNKATWEKIFEYASMPVHGTLSRKLRKGLTIQINEGKVYAQAVLFLGEEFLRITEKNGKEAINTYYAWDKLVNVRTIGETEE